MANGQTKVVDKGYDQIRTNIEAVKKSSIEVGVFAGAETPTGESVAEYAIANEFGYDPHNLPARPFLSTTFDQNRRQYIAIENRLFGDVFTGKSTLRGAMIKLGTRMVNDVKKKITEIQTPRNADSTIAQKGVNNPLIDEGTLRNSIWFKTKILGVSETKKP
jgi:phage gpG-like protein